MIRQSFRINSCVPVLSTLQSLFKSQRVTKKKKETKIGDLDICDGFFVMDFFLNVTCFYKKSSQCRSS